jgi:glycosyltransferase involved in cell wall biosynthesis
MKPASLKLSVVMTSADSCANLERCLPALMAQSFLEFEVVVAVRGSLDGSLSVLEMLRRRLPFKLVVIALERVPSSVALARAIQVSTGETVLFLADDLLLEPETLARHVAFHAVHDRAVAVAPLEFSDGLVRSILRVSWMSFAGANLSVSRGLLQEFPVNNGLDAEAMMLDLAARLEDLGLYRRHRRVMSMPPVMLLEVRFTRTVAGIGHSNSRMFVALGPRSKVVCIRACNF